MRLSSVLIPTLVLVGAAAHGVEMNLQQCEFPDAPELPDGSTASSDEMSQTGNAVREFASEMQESLGCLDQVEADLGTEISDDQKARITTIYNGGVDKLNATVADYNEQIRLFKAQ